MRNLTPADVDYVADLERRGVIQVRSDPDHGRIAPQWVFLTSSWLSQQDRLAELRREASNSEQIELTRRASDAADRASVAADRSATAAERQATAAERANIRATIAIVMATISIIATVVSIWITHMDAHK